MGTLSDNLLKLTEFPFSYSFIGLLALMFGEGLNLDEPSLETVGPLLILMGFVATTLSITDPVGAIQKHWLKGGPWAKSGRLLGKEERPIHEKTFWSFQIFGKNMYEIFETSDNPKASESVLGSLGASFLTHSKRRLNDALQFKILSKSNPFKLFEYVQDRDRWEILTRAVSLRDETLRTTWIVREIDKITSMIYFIIVIATFISSLFIIPGFEDKFLVTFQESNQTRDIAIQHIDAAITAAEAKDRRTLMTEIEEAETAVKQLDDEYVRGLWAKIIIIIFSIGALLGILYKLWKRGRELKEYALMVFKYLAVLEGNNLVRRIIKMQNDTIDKGLQAVEQYLNNGDLTLARITLAQLISDYHNHFSEVIVKPEITKQAGEE